ncbi:uncharacterized protein LOC132695932 isoform X2 [Cylas formicarius]|nr:uncharacterized protein LOC132695932 isoform X2 [Cylas formicarius]
MLLDEPAALSATNRHFGRTLRGLRVVLHRLPATSNRVSRTPREGYIILRGFPVILPPLFPIEEREIPPISQPPLQVASMEDQPQPPQVQTTTTNSTSSSVSPNLQRCANDDILRETTVPSEANDQHFPNLNNNDVPVNVLLPPPRRRHADIPIRRTHRHAITLAQRQPFHVEIQSCGPMTDVCRFCNALFFELEPKNRNNIRLICCKGGEVILPPLGECPRELHQLLTENTPLARQFLNNIRKLNSNFAMASMHATIPADVNVGQGAVCFTITGQIYHHAQDIPLNVPHRDEPIRNNQYYFLDVAEALERRNDFFDETGIDPHLFRILEEMLRRTNVLVHSYICIREMIRERIERDGPNSVANIVVGFKDNINRDRRNFNLPESRCEIAAVFDNDIPFDVDLRVYPRRSLIDHQNKISNLSRVSDPMVYPLLFSHGEDGYDMRLRYASRRDKKVSLRDFYQHRLMVRDGIFSILHNSAKLFQQYVVDTYVKIESQELWWYRTNQRQVRTTYYNRLIDYVRRRVAEAGPNARIGRITILPAAFKGSCRGQNKLYLDAMAVVARHGKPDLFITMTCNPHWPEITQNLNFNQRVENRPELVCRVFHTKLQQFMDDLVKEQFLGIVRTYHYSIEFQKRGLPHAHILIGFEPTDRIDDAEKMDRIISARIPDREVEPDLYGVVRDYYVHRVCGQDNPAAPCTNLESRVCAKGYPKAFRRDTVLNFHRFDGRPEYARPDDGRFVIFAGNRYDNRRIVPYNRWAAMKYRTHINFEGVGSFASIRYLYKYCHKGPDCITIQMRGQNNEVDWDEIRNYTDCRYISSMEACWRIFAYKLHDRSHAVVTLPVHLENEQPVTFDEDDDEDELLTRVADATNYVSKLVAYFRLNAVDPEARRLRYVEIPENYVWFRGEGEWRARQHFNKIVGVIPEVSPLDDERFHLRILLQHLRGATSFESIRTLADGYVCQTYREACEKRRLLANFDIYHNAMREVCDRDLPPRVRNFFALIILVSFERHRHEIPALWEEFKDPYMIADLIRRGIPRPIALRRALINIDQIVAANREGINLNEIGLDDPEAAGVNEANAFVEVRQCAPASDEHENVLLRFGDRVCELNADQRTVYNAVIYTLLKNRNSVDSESALRHFHLDRAIVAGLEADETFVNRNLFFVDGPGGTGKTFLYNVIAERILSAGGARLMAVAWTGIAASLLIEGRTCHHAFRLPLDLDEESTVGWPAEHERSQNIRRTDVILWDEVSMTSKHALNAVDRYVCDVCENNVVPFGGKVVLFGGDFRQTLPIVVRGSRMDILANCVKSSQIWRRVKVFCLQTNLRVNRAIQLATEAAAHHPEMVNLEVVGNRIREYGNWLLRMGEGSIERAILRDTFVPADLIKIDRHFVMPTIQELIEWVYDRVNENDVGDRVILCPTNVAVDDINLLILNRKIIGEPRYYHSVDEYAGNAATEDDEFHVPLDVVHRISASNLPPHELVLKTGAVVVLLKNLDVRHGQCNGTRMMIVRLGEEVLEVKVLSGPRKGETINLPKIEITSSVPQLPRPIKRVQFPIRLAFAMTINKSQGQTYARVGIHLPSPCFAHGQLYVAFSRVGSPEDVRVVIENTANQGAFRRRDGVKLTRNVVYSNIFNNPEPLRQRLPWNPTRAIIGGQGEVVLPARASPSPPTSNEPNNTSFEQDDDFFDSLDLTDIIMDVLRHRPTPRILPIPRLYDNVVVNPYNDRQLFERVSRDNRPGTSGTTTTLSSVDVPLPIVT